MAVKNKKHKPKLSKSQLNRMNIIKARMGGVDFNKPGLSRSDIIKMKFRLA